MRRVEPATMSNGCKALPGDVVYTMKRLGGDSFELTELVYTYSSSMAGGGERGDGCTRGPGKPAQTRVTISAGGSLQIFCSYAQQTVCFSYQRVDTKVPVVKALPSAGKRATAIPLRYSVFDDSGSAGRKLTVFRGSKRIFTGGWLIDAAVKSKVYAIPWTPPSGVTGILRFCVEAKDAAGNASRPSCATLRVR